MAVLPTPGSPMSTGLFLVRRHRICVYPLNLSFSTNQWIQFTTHGGFGQIAAETQSESACLSSWLAPVAPKSRPTLP